VDKVNYLDVLHDRLLHRSYSQLRYLLIPNNRLVGLNEGMRVVYTYCNIGLDVEVSVTIKTTRFVQKFAVTQQNSYMQS